MDDMLEILVQQGPRLPQTIRLESWTARDQEIVAALRFVRLRARQRPDVTLIGVVGGASSGKSTIFNNLVGGRHASLVTMASHTTKGPILAVPAGLESTVAGWLGGRLLMPGFEGRSVAPDDRTPGVAGALTTIAVADDGLVNSLLFDTPDFTTETSRREGDVTHRILPWFDRVLVLVDEERWFDEKTFSRLRNELNRLGTARMVLFNCNEGDVRLGVDDLARLREQAQRMSAPHVVIEYRHGRGFRRLPDPVLQPVADWITRPTDTDTGSDRPTRLLRWAAENAGHALNENAQRMAGLDELTRDLARAVEDQLPATHTILREVVLAPEQRRIISPYWRSVGRSAQWLRDVPRTVSRKILPFGSPTGRPPVAELAAGDPNEDPVQRGTSFFVAEVERIDGYLGNRARDSRFWQEAGTPNEPMAAPSVDPARVEADGTRCARACADALARFEERIATEATTLKVNLTGAGIGAAIGLMLGAVFALPSGGLSVPAGALLGLAIAAGASGLSARSVVRLFHAVRGTPESRALWDTVTEYRSGLRVHAAETAGRITAAARTRTLADEPELRRALETLRDAGPGDVQP
jgi:hypothetical protein